MLRAVSEAEVNSRIVTVIGNLTSFAGSSVCLGIPGIKRSSFIDAAREIVKFLSEKIPQSLFAREAVLLPRDRNSRRVSINSYASV